MESGTPLILTNIIGVQDDGVAVQDDEVDKKKGSTITQSVLKRIPL